MLRTAFTGLAILVLVLAVATVGCKSGETGDGAEVTAAPAPPAPVAPQTDAPEADTVVAAAGGPLLDVIGNEVAEDGGYLCPVSGNVIANTPEELEKHPYVNYEDKSYYVWCPNCEAKFVSDPTGYLAGEVPTCKELGTCDAELGSCDAEGHEHGATEAPESEAEPTDAPE
ncbi:MAG: hypothetical protein KBA64_16045 [Armatimonadetes bacterium]|jgi:hypothetical protein|nr:hypothetical protein [Armatimonadota bacterium]